MFETHLGKKEEIHVKKYMEYVYIYPHLYGDTVRSRMPNGVLE